VLGTVFLLRKVRSDAEAEGDSDGIKVPGGGDSAEGKSYEAISSGEQEEHNGVEQSGGPTEHEGSVDELQQLHS
jgi:hypothetical protein